MKRVCVVGNSHIAALKLGWDIIEYGYPHINLTFFGSPRKNLRDLRVENGALIAGSEKTLKHLQSTSKGQGEITAEKFDVFLVVAMDFGVRRLEDLYRHHRSEEHKNVKGASHYISNACFLLAAKGLLRNTLAFEIAGKLKQLTNNPVMFVPQPLPSADISGDPLWEDIIHHGDDVPLARAFSKIASELTANGDPVIQQPEGTKSGDMFTKSEMSKGSRRLTRNFNVEHPDDDYWHMNQDYGAAVLRNAIRLIKGQV
ncbi:MAG TPA: hypothetical protein VIJ62_10735 [Rhizomicrobium sp.]